MKLRAVFVTGSLVHGGAERHSITVLNRLAERGHECHAVYVKNDPSQLSRIRPGRNGSVLCLDARRFLDPGAVGRLSDWLLATRPTVMIAANGYALLYASLAALRAGLRIPRMVTWHTTEVTGLKEHVKLMLDRPFFWRADCTVFVCEAQRTHWLRRGLGSRSNLVIHNGVDLAHFGEFPGGRLAARESLGLAADDYVIGLSAVMRPEKNHLQLVEAVALLRSSGLPARALMIGDGPLRQRVEQRAAELGIGGHVLITGFRDDVRPGLAASDVMVLCSTSVETFSLAALEAMAMRRPVVHAQLGGAAEMIEPGGNGELFPVGDTRALAGHLARLADKRVAGRMGENARRMVERRFSEAVMVDRYEQVLSGLVEAPPGARLAAGRG